MVAGHIQTPRSGRIDFGKFFQFVGLSADNQPGHVNVTDLRAALGGNIKLMGVNSIFNQGFIDATGPAAEGTYIVSPSVPYSKLSGAGAQWYANYRAHFDSEPSGYAIYGYEAMRVALNAIQRTGKKDRAAIRDAILSTRNFVGPLRRYRRPGSPCAARRSDLESALRG